MRRSRDLLDQTPRFLGRQRKIRSLERGVPDRSRVGNPLFRQKPDLRGGRGVEIPTEAPGDQHRPHLVGVDPRGVEQGGDPGAHGGFRGLHGADVFLIECDRGLEGIGKSFPLTKCPYSCYLRS